MISAGRLARLTGWVALLVDSDRADAVRPRRRPAGGGPGPPEDGRTGVARREAGFVAVLALGMLAGPAQAIDFMSLPPAFVEDFQGEVSSPTTPELDLLGTSGLEVDGTFTGSAAHLTVDNSINFSSDGRFQLLDTETVSTYGSDYGFRAEFENLSLASDGTVNLIIAALFLPVGSGSDVVIAVGIEVETSLGDDFAFLFITEIDQADPTNSTASTLIPLSSSDASAILAGAAIRIDALIDDSAGTVITELEVDGIPVANAGLNLVTYDEQTLSQGVFLLTLGGGTQTPSVTEVDLTRVETWARPLSFEPLYNIDVGGVNGSPSSSFAAAGGPGDWNTFPQVGTQLLLDIDGNAAGVEATLATVPIATIGTGFVNDLRALLTDYTDDCTDPDEWSLDFTGLPDGVYKVRVYAPSGSPTDTGDISINGDLAIGSLPGGFPPELIEGTSWDSALAVVSGGVLSIAGLGTGATSCAGIAGAQLEIGTPITVPVVPALGAPALLGLAGLLLVAGRRARRSIHDSTGGHPR